MRPYEKDPAAIYAASFATVRSEAPLTRFPSDIAEVAIRVIHACGMVEIADRLDYSDDVASSAIAALRAGAPVYADCEMVASGITRRLLPGTDVRCTLNDADVPDMAKSLGTTRSAAAVDLWDTDGAIIAIGNAPTALFRLLERLEDGAPKPAGILGFPVGFVGAAESKAELAQRPRDTPFLTLRGRKGGSAMASAAVNALGILAAGGLQ
ncbi:precorrin-8X methylmutase [Jannaschia donghaensis]|uniref:Precorrin-8X methylmutase n=1 Tax=Jannaschia donghaensis TaxID=420998 RepID=A0A0M6YFP0_9RHOB|nr:precorrin-8X methylmutase [Jannaschia donghaensis]CTQ48323.1 Precorrin-8X methylmutase [Jannaschia donghaensis]